MFKIAYCAGHHLGNPKGISNFLGLGSIREWTLNDRVARYLAEAAALYEGVELLRTDDPTGETLIDIPERCAAANDWGADIYLDLHHNGGIDGGTGGGVVAFSRPEDAKSGEYAKAIYNAVIAAGGLKGNRATPLQTETNFQTFREADMPAVLMEYGFMDSRTDAPIIVTEAYSRLVAYATMEGIAKVAGLRKKAAPADPGTVYRVQVGAYTVKENAENMLQKLEAAGFEGFITAAEKEPQPTPPGAKSVDELAQEVIDGKHGSGDARRKSLGEQYEAVQQRVNTLLRE